MVIEEGNLITAKTKDYQLVIKVYIYNYQKSAS